MKRIAMCLLIGLMSSTPPGVFKVLADLEVSASVQIRATADFHAPLAAHGAWIEVGRYGPCWRPTGVAVEWRPYGYGHWEWTDCGWCWVSDEPWAWACYHYGSWVYDAGGWFWVPGVEWAPAWVSWRVGGGHIGWAPIAPRGVIVAPSLFVFVDGPRFHESIRPNTVIVNNTTIINKTTQITEIKRETRNIGGKPQRVVVNEGPGAEAVQKMTGKKLAAVPVQDVDRKTSVPSAVRRRTLDSSPNKEAAPSQEQKNSAPGRRQDQPSKTSPAQRPAGTDKGKTSPPGNRTPSEKPDKPDRASPPDQAEKQDRAAPPDKQPSGDEAG